MSDTWQVGPYKLREHQVDLVQRGRAAFAQCRREGLDPAVILQGICGSGKTIVSTYIMACALALGLSVAFIVRGRQLVFQKSEKLADCGIEHTVVMANCRGNLRPAATPYDEGSPKCSVISKDTYESLLNNHGIEPFSIDLWIIDECHDAKSEGWFKLIPPKVPRVGLSATPSWRSGLGMGDRWSKLVMGCSHETMLARGMIVPCRVLAPWGADTRGVEVNDESGEYVESQLEQRCMPLVGDFLEEAHKHSDCRQMVFYASSVPHSIKQAEANSEGDGTLFCRPRTWVHIDADTKPKERKQAFKYFTRGDIDGISNYEVLAQGVDLTSIRCIQLGRSFNSLVGFLQVTGRGARLHDGKDEFLILDHGHNCMPWRHGWPQMDREWQLDDRKPMWERERENGPRQSERHCAKCGAVYKPSAGRCPYCGEEKIRTAEMVKTVDGKLEEIEPPTLALKPKKRSVSDEQRCFEKVYFPASKSKSPKASTFNQLKSRLAYKYPHLRIRHEGDRTVVVNLHTKAKHTLGYVPEPHSPLWDLPVRDVPREKLQQPVYWGDE